MIYNVLFQFSNDFNNQIYVSYQQEDNSSGYLSDKQDRYSNSDNGSHTGRFFYDDDGELIGPGEPQWLWISAGSLFYSNLIKIVLNYVFYCTSSMQVPYQISLL